MNWFKRRDKKKQLTNHELLAEIAEAAKVLNTCIRRNVDEGFIKYVSCSEYEVEQTHKLRKLLSGYFKQPLYKFEPSTWVLEQTINGNDNV